MRVCCICGISSYSKTIAKNSRGFFKFPNPLPTPNPRLLHFAKRAWLRLSSATVEKPISIGYRSSKLKAAVQGTPSRHGHAPLGVGLTHAFAYYYHLYTFNKTGRKYQMTLLKYVLSTAAAESN